MIKLIRADFKRLFKDKLFWALSAALIAYAVYKLINHYATLTGNVDYDYIIPIFMDISVISFIIAVFIGFFVGRQFSDGTVRNLISTGASRTAIYLSSVITACVSSAVITVIYAAGSLAVEIGWNVPSDVAFTCLIISLILAVIVSAASVFVVMTVNGRAATAVICIAALALMLYATNYLGDMLGKPEYSYEIATVNGEKYDGQSLIPIDAEITYDFLPNPDYITGAKRTALETVSKLLPTTQYAYLGNLQISNQQEGLYLVDLNGYYHQIESAKDVFEFINVTYPVIFACMLSAGGIYLFKRKDLK